MSVVIPIAPPPDVVWSVQVAVLGLAVAVIAGMRIGRWAKR